MRNYLVLLIAKYCRLLSAANRLKCGKKVKGSILSTLNRLRASLARWDKLQQDGFNDYRIIRCGSNAALQFILRCTWLTVPNLIANI